MTELLPYIGVGLVIAVAAAAAAFLCHRGLMIRRVRHGKTEVEFQYTSSTDAASVVADEEEAPKIQLQREQILLAPAAIQDVERQEAPKQHAIDFVFGEATRHPVMFHSTFASLPLVFGNGVLLLSWDGDVAQVERVLTRHEAYPFTNLWVSCLSQYRKVTLLPYRQTDSARLIQPAEAKRSLSLYKSLVCETQSFLEELWNSDGADVRSSPGLDALLDEAEFALSDGDVGTSVARMEATLSAVHKILLRNAPQGHIQLRKEEPPPPEPPPPPQASETPGVLIVDDDEGIREYLVDLLEREGLHCTQASDPDEALRILVDRDFDVIISDLVMPRKDGRELILAARNSGSRAGIIICTVYSNALKAAKVPCDVFLKKPFSKEELLAAVKSVLSVERSLV